MGLMDVLRGMQNGPHGAPRSGTGSGTGTGSSGGTGTNSASTGTGGTGMSPITMAILGLLAYKALKSMTHQGEPAPAGGNGGTTAPGAGSGNGGHIGSARDTLPSPPSDMAPRDADMGRGWGGDAIPSSGSSQSGTTRPAGTQTSGSQTSGTQTSGTQSGSEAPGSIGDLIKGALGSLLAGGGAGGVMSGGLNDLLKQMQKQGFTDHADSWTGSGPNKSIPPGDLAKVLGPDQIEAMMAQSGLSREELLDGLSKQLPEVVDRLTPDGQVPHHIHM